MTVVIFEGATEDAHVTPVGERLYRLDCNPSPFCATDLEYGDIFEAEENPDGSLKVVGLARKSEWHNYCWIFGRGALDYKTFHCFKDQLDAEGGHWDLVMGGVFIFNLPPESTFQPRAAWDACYERFGYAPCDPEDMVGIVFIEEQGRIDLKERFGPREEK